MTPRTIAIEPLKQRDIVRVLRIPRNVLADCQRAIDRRPRLVLNGMDREPLLDRSNFEAIGAVGAQASAVLRENEVVQFANDINGCSIIG